MMKKIKMGKSFKFIVVGVMFILAFFVASVSESPLEEKENYVAAKPENIEVDENYKIIEIPEDEEEPLVYNKPEPEYEFSFIKPVEGEIITGFSDNELVYSITMGDYRVHKGIDIKASMLQRVISSEEGVIEKAYFDDLMGNTVIINHNNGYKSIYSNLSSLEMVTEGERVEKGKVISGIGDSAICEIGQEAHLHFEITKDNIQQNPEDLIK
jgi:murein DD-endopeptidase MepM/ murein hydrolase activator NlpD